MSHVASAMLGALIVLFLQAGLAGAHRQGERYTYIDLADTSVSGRFEVTLTHIAAALGGDAAATGLTEATFAEVQEAAYRLMEQTLRVTIGDQEFRPSVNGHSFLDTGFDSFVMMTFDMGVDQALPEEITITHLPAFEAAAAPNGVQIPAFFLVGSNTHAGMEENEARHAYIFGASEESYVLAIEGTPLGQVLWEFFRFGLLHIAGGHDHLALLFALVLPAVLLRSSEGRLAPVDRLGPALAPLVTLVGLFTLGHLLAQALAAYGGLSLPFRVSEAVLAASIVALAMANVAGASRRAFPVVAVALGGLHGLGFALYMSAYGLEAAHVAPSLVAFNLAAGLAQAALVGVGVAALFQIRNARFYRAAVVWGGSAVAGFVGLYWLIERIFDINLSVRALLS